MAFGFAIRNMNIDTSHNKGKGNQLLWQVSESSNGIKKWI